jgi:predicted RNase H-like nuclease
LRENRDKSLDQFLRRDLAKDDILDTIALAVSAWTQTKDLTP